jgi:hypothetical protein
MTMNAVTGLIQGNFACDSAPVGYIVSVDLSLSLADMIRAGRYDIEECAIREITEERYPVDRTGELRYNKELFPIPPSRDFMTMSEWHAELLKNGWELERAPELYALCAKYHDLQRQRHIIAFGSSWRIPWGCGNLGSPEAWSVGGRRRTDSRWYCSKILWRLRDHALVSRRDPRP